jgi:hypothetical protein
LFPFSSAEEFEELILRGVEVEGVATFKPFLNDQNTSEYPQGV